MLRTSLRSARLLGGKPIAAAAGRQWPIGSSQQASLLGKRFYADGKKASVDPSKTPVLPTSETQSSERSPPTTLDNVLFSKLPEATEVPLTPPAPPEGRAAPHTTEDDVGESSLSGNKIHPLSGGRPRPPASIDDVGESSVGAAKADTLVGGKPTPPSTIDDVGESTFAQDNVPPPPPPSPPKKKGFFRRLRNALIAFMLLDIALFSGGVWYSRINDNFHDFFTEYVPFGEQAVLYLEELEFKKRFPHANRVSKPRDAGEQIRIPAQSGASWRVADKGEPSGRHSSAAPKVANTAGKQTKQLDDAAKADSSPQAPTPVPHKGTEKVAAKVTEAPQAEPAKAPEKGFKAPEVNEPSKYPPIQPIDLLALPDAKEPLVQDLVHMLNDLIVVINADGAHGKYSTTIAKAKGDVAKVGSKLKAIKDEVEKKAAKEVRSQIETFDKAATELVDRVEKAMIAQESQWRQEYESEMKQARETYDERAKLLLEREKKLSEEKLQNQLLEQAIALKKDFIKDVKDRVEEERDSRLGKLSELSSSVSELEKLTVGWNDVVDSNLKTQQLHVAVEAVRASLEDAHHPRPFIKELVALKEIASDDPIVDAAIASVNPSAYQRGISTSSQLIDRFRRVANEVRKASLLPDDAGVASHASSWVLSHVMFKKQGLAEGADVESILTRAQTFLEEGDLDAAAREVNGLQGWAKTLSKDWLSDVRKVLEVQQALDVIATEARLQSLRVD